MFIVQLFNPEALPQFDGATEEVEYRRENPFDGIEIIGICDGEDEVNRLIDEYQKRENPNKPFQFLYESVRDEIVKRWLKS